MTSSARIGSVVGLLLGGTSFAMAQNGPATGGYPPARWNPNLSYGYYNYGVPYAPPPYATSPGFYGFYGFDPTANNWDYYRVDQPGRGNNAESTR
jgi:hypothetical protein